MGDLHATPTAELVKMRKELIRQRDEMDRKIRRVGAVLGYRDALMFDRMAEKSYREARKPDDPPTLREWWAKKDAERLKGTSR